LAPAQPKYADQTGVLAAIENSARMSPVNIQVPYARYRPLGLPFR
jgi:hypothetical protein